MTQIHLNLINFPYREILYRILGAYPDDYEFTAKGVFRKASPPLCPDCSTQMVHNGFNHRCKEHLGTVKVGRYLCPACRKNVSEDSGFWDDLTGQLFDILSEICQLLRFHHVSYEGIESTLNFLIPRDKDTIRNMVRQALDRSKLFESADIRVVHYDEQHPKAGRNQKYRLTLLDALTNQVIAEKLSDSKDRETIIKFFKEHLDTDKPIFIVTDLYRGYEGIIEEIFGNKATHQLCLFHLNQLIVLDFPKNTTIEQELTKYEMLNIFYNRDLEIEFLKRLADEEQVMKVCDKEKYNQWFRGAKRQFTNFVHTLKLKRRRKGQNLEQRPYHDALKNFHNLVDRIESFEIAVRKRLRRIEKLWPNLTAFYFVDGAPATNNAIENYYSTSLKTHRKKQLHTPGIEDQMKLSALKRAGIFGKPGITLFEALFMFAPFHDPG
ncbi:transposase [Candidatus Methanocrinis natronophilus]|uniref:Transposase n=1 Tax=Candidatus Methanocrinis natronophilus TaxID=3033396 RepID=A0ABT5X8P2_9EURY|nr:transposase [Candidatus Methanocrinis natronophilus]MDF0589618.1 transposase [Candidatus Methanocrinis natronophilus]MDF0590090.1 transposase [Candidatus Methanocrinis natronophilus]MDF0590178.1 transposase [Candidatus Methanocrinis natronophilus]MDF0591040.1 transposase [Candidatus Methanocrinis natronophilus]MDF0591283.1 transposase [Candidatus Methanocrinis natronophilus]